MDLRDQKEPIPTMEREAHKIRKERYVRPAHSSRRRRILKRINRKGKVETEREKKNTPPFDLREKKMRRKAKESVRYNESKADQPD
jgi:hypothetical protein